MPPPEQQIAQSPYCCGGSPVDSPVAGPGARCVVVRLMTDSVQVPVNLTERSPGACDTCFPRRIPAGISGWELLFAGRLPVRYLVHGLAQPGQLPVHLPPRAVGVSQRLVLGKAVPWVVTQHIRERELFVGVE